MRENLTILKQRAALERPTFSVNPLLFRVRGPCRAAILDCRTMDGMWWVLQETCLNDHLLEKDEPLLSWTLQRIWHPLHKKWTWYYRKYKEAGEWNETRTAELVNTCTTLPRWRWLVQSYWWNLFSRWFVWITEIPSFGIASGKISRLCGISKLESQLQEWSMFEISRSSSHTALDQRSWDSKANWRTHDIAIRLRYAWCDDCVCIEKTSRQACST